MWMGGLKGSNLSDTHLKTGDTRLQEKDNCSTKATAVQRENCMAAVTWTKNMDADNTGKGSKKAGKGSLLYTSVVWPMLQCQSKDLRRRCSNTLSWWLTPGVPRIELEELRWALQWYFHTSHTQMETGKHGNHNLILPLKWIFKGLFGLLDKESRGSGGRPHSDLEVPGSFWGTSWSWRPELRSVITATSMTNITNLRSKETGSERRRWARWLPTMLSLLPAMQEGKLPTTSLLLEEERLLPTNTSSSLLLLLLSTSLHSLILPLTSQQ